MQRVYLGIQFGFRNWQHGPKKLVFLVDKNNLAAFFVVLYKPQI